jgi:hypothetical protein
LKRTTSGGRLASRSVEHRQIVDAREARIEFAGAKPDQRFGQLAVDRLFAVAADDHGNARQRRVMG